MSTRLPDHQIKLIGKDTTGATKAHRMALCLVNDVWDTMSESDREAWCERGEIFNTSGGLLLMTTLRLRGASERFLNLQTAGAKSVPNEGDCEKCGRKSSWVVRVADRLAYWCGCGNGSEVLP